MGLLQGRRPDPPPLETDDVRTVAVGTVAWAVAGVVLLALQAIDVGDVRGWWLWMCASGAGFGAVGVQYCRRRRDAIERDKARGRPQHT